VGDRRLMTSLEELLLTEQNCGWSGADVCCILGMSDRLIRQCCQVCRHEAAEHPPATSVSEVGQERGFHHPSRRAVAYRTLFGELPSHTLLRCRYGELPPLSASRPTFDRSLAPDTHASGSPRASVEKLELCLLMSQSSRLDR
jgi:hypothetical protein